MGLIRCSQRRLGSRSLTFTGTIPLLGLVKMGDTDDTFAPQYEYHILEADGEHLKLAAPKPAQVIGERLGSGILKQENKENIS